MTDDFALSRKEIEALRKVGHGDIVERVLGRDPARLGEATKGYRKLAANLRAEREFLTEYLLTDALKGDERDLSSAKETITQLRSQAAQLESTVDRQREEIMHLKSIPAKAVSSEGTGR